jgi:hypothetical protein
MAWSNNDTTSSKLFFKTSAKGNGEHDYQEELKRVPFGSISKLAKTFPQGSVYIDMFDKSGNLTVEPPPIYIDFATLEHKYRKCKVNPHLTQILDNSTLWWKAIYKNDKLVDWDYGVTTPDVKSPICLPQ